MGGSGVSYLVQLASCAYRGLAGGGGECLRLSGLRVDARIGMRQDEGGASCGGGAFHPPCATPRFLATPRGNPQPPYCCFAPCRATVGAAAEGGLRGIPSGGSGPWRAAPRGGTACPHALGVAVRARPGECAHPGADMVALGMDGCRAAALRRPLAAVAALWPLTRCMGWVGLGDATMASCGWPPADGLS